MKLRIAVALACLAPPALAQVTLSPADEAAAFKAAGFVKQARGWVGCADDPSESYTPGTIEALGDLNGDGRPEAVTSEGSTFCYGSTETGYSLLSRQADGSWKVIDAGPGIPIFLETKGAGGWPDLEVGGPGFCFPVLRWNGSEYALNRHEYEGKRCTPAD